jgi:hypothetical protein
MLTSVSAGDDVIITSMMPSATPDQLTYINIVNKDGEGTVYRANSNTRTWLTDSVGEYETTITVDDISKITNENTQSAVAPELVGGYYRIGLEGNKNDLVYVEVYNNNPAREGYINRNYLFIEITALGPFVKIQENDDIQEGDSLTITSLEGKLLYIQGEYMRIEGLDTTTKVVDVARGVNGSAVQTYIPKYSEVYSLLEDNQMTEINYNSVWNVDEPLQIANTPGANFLKMDV